MKKVLTIAGSDCIGGAGLQADLKTMTAFCVYGMSVVSIVTSQNTVSVRKLKKVDDELFSDQIDAVFEDIVPDAVKIGLLSDSKQIEIVAEKLKKHMAKNVVVDPVMFCTSGFSHIDSEKTACYFEKLFPIAKILTPNLAETEQLAGIKIDCVKNAELAVKKINEKSGCSVLLKGFKEGNFVKDLLFDEGKLTWFEMPLINNSNNHGTGCTLSSAIASSLAKGKSVKESVFLAKKFVNCSLEYGLNLGKGIGPINHEFCIKNEFAW